MHGMMKWAVARAVVMGLVLVVAPLVLAAPDPLPLWRDGSPAKAALVDYVNAVVGQTADTIPPEERIAVFDFDGTLFCETAPTYFDWMLYEHRVLDDPSFKATAEQLSLARDSRERGILPGLTSARERIVAEAYRGLTLAEFDAYVRAFMAEPQPGFTCLKRGEAFYRPMVEVVKYLLANRFAVYVCSGTDRLIMRPVVEKVLALPPSRILGSDSTIVARDQDGRDGLEYVCGTNCVLVLGGKSVVKNLQMNKVSLIEKEIGVRPVLAFGNSMTDASMLNWTLGNPRRRALAFMLLCDDTTREYGNLKKAAKMREACETYGWIPVSMRDDWSTIYGDSVKKDESSASWLKRKTIPD